MNPSSRREFLFVSRNEGKRAEFNRAFAEKPIDFIDLDTIGFEEEIPETGATYAENAIIKARALADICELPIVAEDSGIEIDALPDQLGLFSARFGNGMSSEEVNREILTRMADVAPEKRGCRYKAVIALLDRANGIEKLFHGACEGIIHHRSEGSNGFGFDPIFYLPDRGVTMAQLAPEEKNEISHRARAIIKLKDFLLTRRVA